MMLAQGTMLRNGTYRVEEPLSSGGFGNTYLVRNVSFDEVFAMKEFFMRGINVRDGKSVMVSQSDNRATYESQREKFRKEAQCLRKLKNDHIVRVHDMFEENGTVYYVMDYIDGSSVNDLMQLRQGALTELETRKIMMQMLSALKTVHAQDIWHLDIKPGNIMLDKRGRAYLIDFGASKQMKNTGTLSSTPPCYTLGFAPVEQVVQDLEKFGPWTDFYALGATLYYMLTWSKPPSSADVAEGDEAFVFPDWVSEQMKELIGWMMKPQRKLRPQSVEEIEAFLGGQKVIEAPQSQESSETLAAPESPVDSAVSPQEEVWLAPSVNDLFPVSPEHDPSQPTMLASADTPETPQHEAPVRPHAYSPIPQKKRTSPWKIVLPIVLFLLLLLAGVGVYVVTSLLHSRTNDPEPVEVVEDLSLLELTGTVDTYPVTMNLSIEGSRATGTYYYNKQGPDKVLYLSGSYTSYGGSVYLDERTADGQTTGTFSGSYADGVFSGTFYDVNGKSMPFRLTKTEWK